MSSSTLKPKLLLDENVRAELFDLLDSQNWNVKKAAPGAPDKLLSLLSLKEHRVLVTNDSDFCELLKSQVFSVVWLRVPQNDVVSLLASFSKLLSKLSEKEFRGQLIVLESEEKWKTFPLRTKVKLS
ncbi:MAG: DUF5615 family PIN-like protein [Patescibacteria group bacterium]